MNVAWVFWVRKPEHETFLSFRVKSLHPAKKGASSVLRLGSFIVPPMCFSTSGSSCVRSSVRFLNLWLHDSIGMAA